MFEGCCVEVCACFDGIVEGVDELYQPFFGDIMSARPRPVTATVTKPKYPVPVTSTPLRDHFMVLSEGSSTESLISILNHDSCESIPPSDDDKETARKKEPSKIEKDSESEGTEQREQDTSRSYTFPTTTSTKTPESQKPEVPLSPWENWLIHKAQELRLQQEHQLKELRKLQEAEGRKTAEKKEKEGIVKEKVKEWVEAKTLQEKLFKKAENHKMKAELAMKEEEKRQIEEKANQKFEEWQRKKEEEMKEQKKIEREKKKREEEEKAEKLRKNEESYRKWLKEARKRPKSAPHSLGYIAGKLTGYYNATCYPAPSFCNPIPWKPIHIPKPKEEKKPQKQKAKPYRWNPNKYL